MLKSNYDDTINNSYSHANRSSYGSENINGEIKDNTIIESQIADLEDRTRRAGEDNGLANTEYDVIV